MVHLIDHTDRIRRKLSFNSSQLTYSSLEQNKDRISWVRKYTENLNFEHNCTVVDLIDHRDPISRKLALTLS